MPLRRNSSSSLPVPTGCVSRSRRAANHAISESHAGAHRAVDLAEGERDVLAPLAGRELEAGHQLAGITSEGRDAEGNEEGRDARRLQGIRDSGYEDANFRLDTSLPALEAKGVTQKATKKGGMPDACRVAGF